MTKGQKYQVHRLSLNCETTFMWEIAIHHTWVVHGLKLQIGPKSRSVLISLSLIKQSRKYMPVQQMMSLADRWSQMTSVFCLITNYLSSGFPKMLSVWSFKWWNMQLCAADGGHFCAQTSIISWHWRINWFIPGAWCVFKCWPVGYFFLLHCFGSL